MTENEQIQEMAWDICDIPKHPSIKSCDDCNCKTGCHAQYYAKRAYNADFRKVERGEWVKQERKSGVPSAEAVCSRCGRDVVYQIVNDKWEFESFCPHCGADMRGTEE